MQKSLGGKSCDLAGVQVKCVELIPVSYFNFFKNLIVDLNICFVLTELCYLMGVCIKWWYFYLKISNKILLWYHAELIFSLSLFIFKFSFKQTNDNYKLFTKGFFRSFESSFQMQHLIAVIYRYFLTATFKYIHATSNITTFFLLFNR